ncbi:hypothetical protein QBC36DRAFT_237172 [Triangularia setosa]|uniref:Ribonucleases P/MRP subunit Pop8-like domain-containing protein n=1 Tax=Triangularia setosa TaxID=2587417 RepID=A0AAN6WBU0_9PEZI|nr:hypothetical protein QBC36DRAFT_237172 [Podospora setosa]
MTTTPMDIDPFSSLPKTKKSFPLTTLTLSKSQYSYAHLTLLTPSSSSQTELDNLQLKSYLTSALSQFLGQTGAAIPIDILYISDSSDDTQQQQQQQQQQHASTSFSAWVRLPRPDLAAFSAAVTAFPGISSSGKDNNKLVLRVEAAGDYLGALLGRGEEQNIWGAA